MSKQPEEVKDDGSLHKCWINQMQTDNGRPQDLHSISLMHNHRRGMEGAPVTATQIPLLGQQRWTTNIGLMTSDELYQLHMVIGDHLRTTGYFK